MGGARADRLEGNRIWRVRLPDGSTVLQKHYGERGGALHCRLRDWGSRLRGLKTGTRAAARRATEARLLAAWRAAGFDVPQDLSARHPELADERTLVLEDVPGETLRRLLIEGRVQGARRAELLARYAAATSARMARALARSDVDLVQEHGTADHVLVSGERLVTIDLENGYRAGRDVAALVSKELAGIVRSLAFSGAAAPDAADLAALLAGWGERAILADAVERYLRPHGALARRIAAVDRARRPSKYAALAALDAALAGARAP